jgi:branched-chain amino acid transport system substrate-binding protein
VLRGAQLALERHGGDAATELIALDSFGADRDQQAVTNARRAADDPDALAYIGDFHSSQVLETSPILAEAGLLQVAPVATFVGLGGPTLVCLMPHDGVGAKAIAAWLLKAGVHELLVVHDHDEGYGVPVGAMCVEAARERGMEVRTRPVWDHDERPADDLREAQAVLYVGVAGSGAVDLWRHLHEANPKLWLLGAEGMAVRWFAAELAPSVAERTRFFVAPRAPLAFYGYEAMALALDATTAGGGDRAATARAARSARDRESSMGRYSIDEAGHTTSIAYGRLAISGGELAWDLD